MVDQLPDVVALFPGQGAFDGAALCAIAREHPEVREVFSEIDTVTLEECGRALSATVLDNGPVTLAALLADEPWLSQLAIYGTSLAVYRILHRLGLRPTTMMGHSLGEIAALVCAGVYTVADGTRVIRERVRAVAETGPRDGYMAALSCDARRADAIVELVADKSLAVAVRNHATQTVLSGSAEAMDTAQLVAAAAEVPWVRLESPAPFHGPLLRPAAERFALAIRDIPVGDPRLKVYSPILLRAYSGADDLPAVLATHLVDPVMFPDAVRALHADGARYYVECGALSTLAKFVSRIIDDPAVTVVPGLSTGADPLTGVVRRLRAAGLVVSDDPHPSMGQGNSALAEFWADRGHLILDYVRHEFERHQQETSHQTVDPVSAPPSAPPWPESVVPGPEHADDAPPDRDEVAARLRHMYADALEYPEEVFTDDVELEAELGIDSVKQVELLTRVSEAYGLPVREGGFRLSDYHTMGKVIDYTMRMLSDRVAVHA